MRLQQGVERERKREGKEPHLPDNLYCNTLMLVKSYIGHASVGPHHTFTTSCKQAQGQPKKVKWYTWYNYSKI